MSAKRKRIEWLEAKIANRVSVWLLRVGAAILITGPVAILLRGYLVIDGRKEDGPTMYALVAFGFFWAVILWLWSPRESKEE